MDNGFYTSAVGMMTDFSVEEEISNNLANVNTPGYKDHNAVLQSFHDTLLRTQTQDQALNSGFTEATVGRVGYAPEVQRYALDLSQGAPTPTGNPLDVALVGNGFLTVRSGNRTLLTRNGALHRGADGTLLTSAGYTVLGTNGQSLRVPTGTVQIDRDGAVSLNGRTVGRLGFQTIPTGAAITELGDGYYQARGQAVAAGTGTLAVIQGSLEHSNVDLSSDMTALLSMQRAYQMDARMMQMQDDTLSLTVNDLAKVQP